MEKTCKDCGGTKPESEFHRDKARADGRSIRCKTCTNIMLAIYQKRTPRHQSPAGMKWCSTCKAEKPLAEFSRNKVYHDGLARTCRSCNNKRSAEYGRKHRARLGARALERYHAAPEQHAEYSIKRHYGLPHGTYARMLTEQDGKCAICQTTEPGGPSKRIKRFHIDHCHETGRVRALLCENCNNGIGRFHDDPAILRLAAEYLEWFLALRERPIV